jgi:hypothetical protein
MLDFALGPVPGAFSMPIHPAAAADLRYRGGPDHRLSGARAERASAALADQQTEASAVLLWKFCNCTSEAMSWTALLTVAI